ncbi:putative leucine-rich repeat protein [Hordeum vulgare]|nr:putative leucine-rich repeat protein [Hordeum vulgare]
MAPMAAESRLPLAAIVLVAITSTLLLAPPVVANQDADALSALRRGLQDPNGTLKSWDPNLVNACTWFHITCDDNKRVTRIDLNSLNLSGPLVPELGKLDRLQYLWISWTNIQGTIPEELGDLENLKSLHLHNNTLSGQIPASLGKLKSLEQLHLQQNRLTGPIPSELAGLPDQMSVDLSSNDLCGPIPTHGPFNNIHPPNGLADNPRLGGNC